MNVTLRLGVLLSLIFIFYGDKCRTNAEASIFSLVHDLLQYNVAGVPVIHEKTEWNFDPEVGKKRRVRYEEENGRYGEIAIAKIGMGIEYKGPWGTKVKNENTKLIRQNLTSFS